MCRGMAMTATVTVRVSHFSFKFCLCLMVNMQTTTGRAGSLQRLWRTQRSGGTDWDRDRKQQHDKRVTVV